MSSAAPAVRPSAALSGAVVDRDTAWTWGQLTDHFLDGYSRNRPATARAYTGDLIDWTAWCASVNVDPLRASRQYVQAYVNVMSDRGLARSTIARRLSTLSRCYKLAVDEGQLLRSPTTGVDRPKVALDSQTTGLDRDETAALRRAALASGPRDHALVTLLVMNGLRISEALGADVTDLGSSRGHRILTVTGKGGSRAVVALAPVTVEALEAYLDGRSEGPLFATRTGGRLDRATAFRMVRRIAAAAGLDKAETLGLHSLRHTFVTAALDAGVPLHIVQDAARHADPRTTRRYDRARHNLDDHATYAVASYLARGS